MRLALIGLVVVMAVLLIGEDKRTDRCMEKMTTPGEQYDVLAREFENAAKAFKERVQAAKTPRERGRLYLESYPDERGYGQRMLAFAERHPGDPKAVDALVWVMQHSNRLEKTVHIRAFAILRRDHLTSDRLDGIFESVIVPDDKEWHDYLRILMDKNPSRKIKGRACLALAESLHAPFQFDDNTGDPAICPTLNKEVEDILEQAVRDFGDVEIPNFGTVGKKAAGILFECRSLVIGKQVPDIAGEDEAGGSFRLSDYQGKVILLHFWWHKPFADEAMYAHDRVIRGRYDGRPFALIGVNSDDKKTLRQLVHAGTVTWRSFWDGGNENGPIAVQWCIRAWPTLYLIDAEGVIRHKWIGTPDSKLLYEAIGQLVAEAEGHARANGGARHE